MAILRWVGGPVNWVKAPEGPQVSQNGYLTCFCFATARSDWPGGKRHQSFTICQGLVDRLKDLSVRHLQPGCLQC